MAFTVPKQDFMLLHCSIDGRKFSSRSQRTEPKWTDGCCRALLCQSAQSLMQSSATLIFAFAVTLVLRLWLCCSGGSLNSLSDLIANRLPGLLSEGPLFSCRSAQVSLRLAPPSEHAHSRLLQEGSLQLCASARNMSKCMFSKCLP